MNYTSEQLAVANATENLVRVKALAGTGKTETSVLRVITQESMNRKVGQVFTFTVSARETISKRLAERGLSVPVRTLHSFALEQVNNYRKERGLEPMKPSDGSKVVRAMFLEETDREPTDRDINEIRQMSALLNNGSTYPQRIVTTERNEVIYLAERYRAKKIELGSYDWDDLIGFALLIAQKLGTKIDGEILIDEAQDLTLLQMQYVEALSSGRITLVLDPNQSIFGFSGAEQAASERPGYTEYTLSKSFRSAQEILDRANVLIPENLTSDITGGEVTWLDSSLNGQAQDVAKILRDGDCVIARFKANCQEITDLLDLEHQPPHAMNCQVTTKSGETYTFGSIHWAKGKEWPRVIVLGLCENGFTGLPWTDEEQRVMYVALTQAKTELVLVNQTIERPRWLN